MKMTVFRLKKMQHLTDKMAEQMVKAQDLDNEIRKQLARVGYEF